MFQVKLYEHATLGHLYRVYVGPDDVFPQAPTYAENLFIIEIGGELKIVSVYGFNRRFPQRKGYRYFTDHGLAWDHSSGAEITALGTPSAVRKFQAPRDVSGTLREYYADRELEPFTLPEGLEVFIERLKQGDVEFYTRHQEDEWGCRYLGEGRFERWSRNYMDNRDETEELDEMGVIKLLSRYSVEGLQKGLIASGHRPEFCHEDTRTRRKTNHELEQTMWRLQLRDFSSYLTFSASTWADVEQVLRRLDGFRHDDARLEYAGGGADEACLNVGGGEAGRVVVGIQTVGADYLHLIDPAQDEALTTQSVGGQETPLPGTFYVRLEMALQAARYFYRHRAADPALPWVAPGVEGEC